MEKFESGAHRDDQKDKPRYDLISPYAMKRLAIVMKEGAKKYGDRNWEKGMPTERCLASLLRHIYQYQLGEKDEDHLGHAMFNLMAIMHFEDVEKENIPKDKGYTYYVKVG